MEISGLGQIPGTTGLSVRGSDMTAVQFKIRALQAELSQLRSNTHPMNEDDRNARIGAIEGQLNALQSMHERLADGRSTTGERKHMQASDLGIRQPGVGLNYDMRV